LEIQKFEKTLMGIEKLVNNDYPHGLLVIEKIWVWIVIDQKSSTIFYKCG
jgi:hypothetical protein